MEKGFRIWSTNSEARLEWYGVMEEDSPVKEAVKQAVHSKIYRQIGTRETNRERREDYGAGGRGHRGTQIARDNIQQGKTPEEIKYNDKRGLEDHILLSVHLCDIMSRHSREYTFCIDKIII